MQTPYVFSMHVSEDWERGVTCNLRIQTNGPTLKQTAKYRSAFLIKAADIGLSGEIYEVAPGENRRIWLIDESGGVWMYDYVTQYKEVVFSAGKAPFSQHANLAVSAGLLLVADVESEYGLSAYALGNRQIIWGLREWEGKGVFPLAVTVEDGTIYALMGEASDRDGWIQGALILFAIEPSGRVKHVVRLPNLSLEFAVRGVYLQKRYTIACCTDEYISILDTRKNELVLAHLASGHTIVSTLLPSVQASGITAVDGVLYMGNRRETNTDSGEERFILSFSSSGAYAGKTPGYRGRADKIACDPDGRLYVLNSQTGIITVLEKSPRTKEREDTGLPEGFFLSQSFDSGTEETIWHKIEMEASIPDETQLRIYAFASDSRTIILDGQAIDLDQWLSNSAILPHEKFAALHSFWSEPIINPKDALLFRQQGRYLWLKIEWIGSDQKAPVLHRLRLHFPRHSYLSYLPAVYQEENASRDFLTRYLSLFETFVSETEQVIDHTFRYFDPDYVSGPFLNWLASWLGISTDDSWTEEKKKALLKVAPLLYRQRGTKHCLQTILEIYTGEKPFIVEPGDIGTIQNPDIKRVCDQLYDMSPYSFIILIKAKHVQTEAALRGVKAIISSEKPAFVEARLVILQPHLYLDWYTYLGINTYLSEWSLLRLDDTASIPHHTVLIDVDQENRMDVHTRLELDSELE